MFRPLSIFIGLRYTRSKQRRQFISLISLISMLGVCLGVIVLITILSVLNGFDREIKKSIFSMMPPITISSFTEKINHWKDAEKMIRISPGVTGVAPFIHGQALLQNSNSTQPAIIMGILPNEEKTVSALSDKMTQGKTTSLMPGTFSIILGANLADQLGVSVGDKITLVTPEGSFTSSRLTPHFKIFTVSGIFRATGGGFNYDAKLAFIHLQDAQQLFHFGNAISALHVNVENIYLAPVISKQLENQLTSSARIVNWTQQLGDFFENIKVTKSMMFFIFILIIIVAVFNLVCTLVMAVNNKRADIAILRTMGASPRHIMAIFIVQGILIGSIGTFLGVAGGVWLANHVTEIVNGIQNIFHVKFLSSTVYFVDYLPSELHKSDVIKISVVSVILSLLATLYPSWSAARTQPAEALRYE